MFGAESTYVRYEAKIVASLKSAPWVAEGTSMYFYSPSGFTCSISTLQQEEIYLIAGRICFNCIFLLLLIVMLKTIVRYCVDKYLIYIPTVVAHKFLLSKIKD